MLARCDGELNGLRRGMEFTVLYIKTARNLGWKIRPTKATSGLAAVERATKRLRQHCLPPMDVGV